MKESIFSSEKKAEFDQLREGKNKKREIASKLDFLIENDSSDKKEIFLSRRKKVENDLNEEIGKLKSLGFEKAINILLRYQFAESLLHSVPEVKNYYDEIRKFREEYEEKIKKHSDKYSLDIEKKKAEFDLKNISLVATLDDEIEKEKKLIEVLQELAVSDSEFQDEYVKTMNDKSRVLSLKERDRAKLIIESVSNALDGCPGVAGILKKMEETEKILEPMENESGSFVVDILEEEILPAGEGLLSGAIRNKTGEWEGRTDLVDVERIEFIKSLKPIKEYRSAKETLGREYAIFEFPNHMFFVSKWSFRAIYIIPRVDNWQNLSQMQRDELHYRGAMQIKKINGWKDKIKDILDGKVEFNLDLKSEYIPQPLIDWGDEPGKWAQIIRERFLSYFEDLQIAIDLGCEKEAKEFIIKNSDFKTLEKMGIATGIFKFGRTTTALAKSFPDLDLSPYEFKGKKRFSWKDSTPEERIANVRRAVFDNYPHIKIVIDNALESGDLNDCEEALGWFSLLNRHEELAKCGLISAMQAKVFGTKEKMIQASFPEIEQIKKNAEELIKFEKNPESENDVADKHVDGKARRVGYGITSENYEKWKRKIRNAFLEEIPELKSVLGDKNFALAKNLILRKIEIEGGSVAFYKKKKCDSARNIEELKNDKGKLTNAFPELDWSDMIVSKGRKK